jgi:hypothetical protein
MGVAFGSIKDCRDVQVGAITQLTWLPKSNHGLAHGITGTVDKLFAGAPSITFLLIAR